MTAICNTMCSCTFSQQLIIIIHNSESGHVIWFWRAAPPFCLNKTLYPSMSASHSYLWAGHLTILCQFDNLHSIGNHDSQEQNVDFFSVIYVSIRHTLTSITDGKWCNQLYTMHIALVNTISRQAWKLCYSIKPNWYLTPICIRPNCFNYSWVAISAI